MNDWPAYQQSSEGPTLAEVAPSLGPYFALQPWCPFAEVASVDVLAEVIVYDTWYESFTLLLLELSAADGSTRRCFWAAESHPAPSHGTGHAWATPPVEARPGVVALEWHLLVSPTFRRVSQVNIVYDALLGSSFRALLPGMMEYDLVDRFTDEGRRLLGYWPGLSGDYFTEVLVKPDCTLHRHLWPEVMPPGVELDELKLRQQASPPVPMGLRFHRFAEGRPSGAWETLPQEQPRVFAALTLDVAGESYLLATAERMGKTEES